MFDLPTDEYHVLLDMTLGRERKFNLATGLPDLLQWGKGQGDTGLCVHQDAQAQSKG